MLLIGVGSGGIYGSGSDGAIINYEISPIQHVPSPDGQFNC